MKRYPWLAALALAACGGEKAPTDPTEAAKDGGMEMTVGSAPLCCALGKLGQQRCSGTPSLVCGAAESWQCEPDADLATPCGTCGVGTMCASVGGDCTGTVATCP